jgi:hypothetical protein
MSLLPIAVVPSALHKVKPAPANGVLPSFPTFVNVTEVFSNLLVTCKSFLSEFTLIDVGE